MFDPLPSYCVLYLQLKQLLIIPATSHKPTEENTHTYIRKSTDTSAEATHRCTHTAFPQ